MVASTPGRTRACAALLGLYGCASVTPGATPIDASPADGAVPADAPTAADGTTPIDRVALDFGPPVDRPPPEPGRVYANSADQLYLLEPISKRVTTIGVFDCTTAMVDIAVDRSGRMTGVALILLGDSVGGAVVSIDPATAHCEVLARGADPVSALTYVPEGTLSPDAEALVGYAADRYLRVDPATGALTDIGRLNNGASGGTKWISSGDVVSIAGGGTYLTVKPETGTLAGGDRIVEIDPATGALVRIIGPIGIDDAQGLGYWGGIAYGFTLGGILLQIDLAGGAGTVIPIPNAPPLSFLGAGTTTIAPITVD
jgi:hypothetical protein